jgi:PucR-like helix-turn-helix protein
VAQNVITLVLPDLEEILADIPGDLAGEDELDARIRLAFVNTHVSAGPDDLEDAVGALRTRVVGNLGTNPFGARTQARTFVGLADAADRALAAGRLDLATVLSLQFESGYVAATRGRRLILFLALNAAVRRAAWERGSAEIERLGLGPARQIELGRWLLLWAEMSTLATSEGYRAAERDILARDIAAQRAAMDELLGSVSAEGHMGARVRRLAMRYGLDPDATYRLAAVLPGPDADPTPDAPGIDDADLETMADRIDRLLRRPTRRESRAGTGLRLPLAITWRGAIVAILGPDPHEWQRLKDAIATVLGAIAPSWTAIAVPVDGVAELAGSLLELQEGLRVADGIGRRGLIDDLAELGVERLLLGDPELASTVIARELGALLADPRMGNELIETLQVFFDAGQNGRETARRLHLADRTVAYRLERAESLLGHGFDGEPGRRLSIALTLRRLEGLRQAR